jgi:Phosphoenolpyruvate carboxylase
VHERTVGELFEMTCADTNYAALPEAARISLLREELKTARLLSSPFLRYSAETASELAILREAADAHLRYGKAAVPNYVISKTNGVSDLLEAALLLKEAGLLRPRERKLRRAAANGVCASGRPTHPDSRAVHHMARARFRCGDDARAPCHQKPSRTHGCRQRRLVYSSGFPSPWHRSARDRGSARRCPANRLS